MREHFALLHVIYGLATLRIRARDTEVYPCPRILSLLTDGTRRYCDDSRKHQAVNKEDIFFKGHQYHERCMFDRNGDDGWNPIYKLERESVPQVNIKKHA